jgi:hypothetical protein
MPAVLAAMETPCDSDRAARSRGAAARRRPSRRGASEVAREVFPNRFGGAAAGRLPDRLAGRARRRTGSLAPFISALFPGALCLFLLAIGHHRGAAP